MCMLQYSQQLPLGLCLPCTRFCLRYLALPVVCACLYIFNLVVTKGATVVKYCQCIMPVGSGRHASLEVHEIVRPSGYLF